MQIIQVTRGIGCGDSRLLRSIRILQVSELYRKTAHTTLNYCQFCSLAIMSQEHLPPDTLVTSLIDNPLNTFQTISELKAQKGIRDYARDTRLDSSLAVL